MGLTVKSNQRKLTVIGLFLILAGLVLNEWILTRLFSPDASLESSTRVTIWLFDVIFVLSGGLLIFLRKKISLKVLIINVVLFGVLLCLFLILHGLDGEYGHA